MLYPSQVEARDAVRTAVQSEGAVCLVDGLSGAGKSLIVQQALADSPGAEVMEAGKALGRVRDINERIRTGARTVILSQPGRPTDGVVSKIMPESRVTVRCLKEEEVGEWLDGVEPALSAGEKLLVRTYALGVPMLIERFCRMRPVTRENALAQCAMYLQGVVESCAIGGTDRDAQLKEALRAYTTFPVPDDALPLLADWEYKREAPTPLTILGRRLRPDAEFPAPATLQIFDLYAQWLTEQPEEPTFDVFARGVAKPEEFLRTLGFCDFPERDTLLSRFPHPETARKGATFFAGFGGSFSRQMYNLPGENLDLDQLRMTLARASGLQARARLDTRFGREMPVVDIDDAPDAFHLHKHDHTHGDVMSVAYATECALQSGGHGYVVRYDKRTYKYDPARKLYEPLELTEVNYYAELFPDSGEDAV